MFGTVLKCVTALKKDSVEGQGVVLLVFLILLVMFMATGII